MINHKYNNVPRPFFTGIGSRRAPVEALQLLSEFSAYVEQMLDVYTGDAFGCDRAFSSVRSPETCLIFNPNSNGCTTPQRINCSELPSWSYAYELAKYYHPAWNQLSSYARDLITRNAYQVLGLSLDERSRFVVCWTPDGANRYTTKQTGGTGQAIRIAVDHDIPVYNIGNAGDLATIQCVLNGTLPVQFLIEGC